MLGRRTMASVLGGIADAYGDANFRRYSVGSIVSWLSFFIQAVAVAWVTWDLTHSTGWLATIALLDAVPMSVLAPLGGIIADRYDRFRILMAAYAVAALQSALLAGLAFGGSLTIERLAGLTLLHGIVHAFSVPAQFGLLPRFVERRRLPSAIAVASAYTQLGIFVGPALAGWVIVHLGPGAAFASNVAGYGLYFWSAALLETPADYRPAPRSSRSAFGDFRDGLRMVAGHRGMVALLGVMALGYGLNAAVRQMLPAFADRGFQAGVSGLATLLAGAGIGATIAALWIAQGGAKRIASDRIVWAFLGYLAATAAFLVVRGLGAGALAMAARGFFFEVCSTGTVALLQVSTPDALRGRLMSTQFLLQQGASAAGVGLVGLVALDQGLRLPLACMVAAALLVWLATFNVLTRGSQAFTPEPRH